MTAATEQPRLDVDLPDGWWCLDLTEPVRPDQVAALFDDGRRPGPNLEPSPNVEQGALATANWLRGQGARIALLRPGNDRLAEAICGGVFVIDAMPAAQLYAALDEQGEAVALGDLDGIPIISHVRRAPVDASVPTPAVHISYFICALRMCIVITFAAPEIRDVKGVVREVAKIVSAARVVHSGSGCPV